MRLSGVDEQKYIPLYGKSYLIWEMSDKEKVITFRMEVLCVPDFGI
jgi:hypothetical protein